MLRGLHLPRRHSSSFSSSPLFLLHKRFFCFSASPPPPPPQQPHPQNTVGGTLKQATGRVLHDRSLEWEGILQRQKELGTPRADRAVVEAGMAADLSVMRHEPVAGYPTDAPGIRSSNNQENYRQNSHASGSGRARHEERGRKDDEEETRTKQGQTDEEKREEAKEKRKSLEEDRMKAEYKKEWQ
ncbi:hypothetical protein QOT17_008830 [Balamuthia mandrillaris]